MSRFLVLLLSCSCGVAGLVPPPMDSGVPSLPPGGPPNDLRVHAEQVGPTILLELHVVDPRPDHELVGGSVHVQWSTGDREVLPLAPGGVSATLRLPDACSQVAAGEALFSVHVGDWSAAVRVPLEGQVVDTDRTVYTRPWELVVACGEARAFDLVAEPGDYALTTPDGGASLSQERGGMAFSAWGAFALDGTYAVELSDGASAFVVGPWPVQ